MGQLRISDVRAGLRLLHALGESIDDPSAFGERGVELLPSLVAADLTTLSVCDLASGRRQVVGRPAHTLSAHDRAAFDRHFDAHPLVRFHAHDGGRTTRRISDSVPFSRFRQTALYADYYRRIGIDHAMALPVYVDDHWLVSFVFNRTGRDFADRDIEVLNLLRDGLGALYRSAQLAAAGRGALAGLQDALEAAGSGVARVDARNGLLYATLRGAAHLRRYCGRPAQVGERLPAPLSDWLERVRGDALGGRAPSLVLHAGTGQLTVRALPAPGAAGSVCLLTHEAVAAAPDDAVVRAEAAGLTPREREVVRWLAAGKSDRDIAAILGISVRTVHKHLQRAYEKLGVETRTAAVLRLLNRPRSGDVDY